MLGKDGATSGPRTFTAREIEVAQEHGADTSDRGRSFYEHSADTLKHSQPIGSYAQGCPHCGKVVPDTYPQSIQATIIPPSTVNASPTT